LTLPSAGCQGEAVTFRVRQQTALDSIALTALDLTEEPAALAAAREEFLRRRDEADPRYQQPLLPADFAAPADLPWPQYVQTERGYEWCLPTTANFGDEL
jgi:aminobenzoyl-glutamate utilization protein B